MRLFALIVLIAGLFLSGGAVWYMYNQFKTAEARLRDAKPEVIKVATVEVAVANRKLSYGEPLDAKAVRMVEWPKDALPADVFTSLDEVVREGDKVRVALRRMEKNEPILPQKISGFGERPTVAALLDPGMLAYTLSVDATNSVGGFLLPGTHIDIILTVNDKYQGLITYFLMQNVEVIAVDQDTDTDRIKARVARTVTIQVNPEELKALTLASNVGKVTIALRGFDSTVQYSNESLSRDNLLGEQKPEAAPQAPEQTVRVRRNGNEVQVLTVE